MVIPCMLLRAARCVLRVACCAAPACVLRCVDTSKSRENRDEAASAGECIARCEGFLYSCGQVGAVPHQPSHSV